MNAQECLQLLREMKDVAFATVDERGKPQVRIIDVMLAENGRLYFVTARGKPFYRQLLASGEAAITGLTDKFQMVRLQGPVEKLEQQEQWLERIFEANPSMKEVYPGESRRILEPFCIPEGELEYFDLSCTPIYREVFSLGNMTVVPKGYAITNSCIGCGACLTACPQQCIQPAVPYEIEQPHCLHCGLCYELCPARAIQPRGDHLPC